MPILKNIFKDSRPKRPARVMSLTEKAARERRSLRRKALKATRAFQSMIRSSGLDTVPRGDKKQYFNALRNLSKV